MIEEIIFFVVILASIVVAFYFLSTARKRYIIKWMAASLIMPLIVMVYQGMPQGLVLLFWPGSIGLMSLGAEKRPILDVVYVWCATATLNVALYFVLGLIFSMFIQKLKNVPNETNEKT